MDMFQEDGHSACLTQVGGSAILTQSEARRIVSQCVGVVRVVKYVRAGHSAVGSASAQHARLVRTSVVARARPTGTPSHPRRGSAKLVAAARGVWTFTDPRF